MRSIADAIRREVPTLGKDERLQHAVRTLVDSGMPALPVVDGDGRYVGLFGEREFITAVFPGYVGELGGAGFITKSVDRMLETRASCRLETVGRHMNTERVSVRTDHSDVHLAEIFLHHRVLLVPVVDDRRVLGAITRSEFFVAVAERFLEHTG